MNVSGKWKSCKKSNCPTNVKSQNWANSIRNRYEWESNSIVPNIQFISFCFIWICIFMIGSKSIVYASNAVEWLLSPIGTVQHECQTFHAKEFQSTGNIEVNGFEFFRINYFMKLYNSFYRILKMICVQMITISKTNLHVRHFQLNQVKFNGAIGSVCGRFINAIDRSFNHSSDA